MIPSQTPLPKIPLGSWVETLINWIQMYLHGLLGLISQSGASVNDALVDVLLAIPPLIMVVVFILIAWPTESWRLAVGAAVTLLPAIPIGQWTNAMETLVLVTLATVTALIFAIPLGTQAARNEYTSALVHPVLNPIQIMPAFIYLIPSVLFLSIGVVPGMFVMLIFAVPPGVRVTGLGIKQMDKGTVETEYSPEATDWQTLRGTQLPLAVPTITTGVNQVIMLVLSMAAIAGMAGASGLGKEAVKVFAAIDTARGTGVGLSTVLLAIFLDRVTAVLGVLREEGSLLSFLKKR